MVKIFITKSLQVDRLNFAYSQHAFNPAEFRKWTAGQLEEAGTSVLKVGKNTLARMEDLGVTLTSGPFWLLQNAFSGSIILIVIVAVILVVVLAQTGTLKVFLKVVWSAITFFLKLFCCCSKVACTCANKLLSDAGSTKTPAVKKSRYIFTKGDDELDDA